MFLSYVLSRAALRHTRLICHSSRGLQTTVTSLIINKPKSSSSTGVVDRLFSSPPAPEGYLKVMSSTTSTKTYVFMAQLTQLLNYPLLLGAAKVNLDYYVLTPSVLPGFLAGAEMWQVNAIALAIAVHSCLALWYVQRKPLAIYYHGEEGKFLARLPSTVLPLLRGKEFEFQAGDGEYKRVEALRKIIIEPITQTVVKGRPMSLHFEEFVAIRYYNAIFDKGSQLDRDEDDRDYM